MHDAKRKFDFLAKNYSALPVIIPWYRPIEQVHKRLQLAQPLTSSLALEVEDLRRIKSFNCVFLLDFPNIVRPNRSNSFYSCSFHNISFFGPVHIIWWTPLLPLHGLATMSNWLQWLSLFLWASWHHRQSNGLTNRQSLLALKKKLLLAINTKILLLYRST